MPMDRVPFTLNEQFQSVDLTSMQRLAERYLEDVAAYAQRPMGLEQIGNTPHNDGPQPAIALVGGLGAYLTGGATLEIATGMLLSTEVDSPDNPSLSGAYLCTNPASALVALPTPVADTWCVICARPLLVNDAPVVRRVWNEALSRWDNTNLVKRQRSTIAFDVVASAFAGQLPFVYPANAVPIWAVLRPAGGGPVLESHVIDLRPVRPLGGAGSRGAGSISCGVSLGHSAWSFTAAELLKLNVHLQHENLDLHAVTTAAGLDPMLFKNPDDAAPSAGEWWYLYLARFPQLGPYCAPRHAQLGAADLAQQGLLVLSKVVPRSGDFSLSRVNSLDIRAPDPFAANIGAGQAALFGALKRSGSTWLPCQGDGDRVTLLGNISASAATGSVTSFTFDHEAPLGARAVTLQIDSTAPATLYEIDRPDGTVSLYVRPAATAAEIRTEVEVPLGPLGNSTTLRLRSTLAGNWTHRMRSYRI